MRKKLTLGQYRRLVAIAGATVAELEREQSLAAASLRRLSNELRKKRATLNVTIMTARRVGAL